MTDYLRIEEPVLHCKLGQLEKCCAFLACGENGFECLLNTPLEKTIRQRLEQGTMNAKGEGMWEECLQKK